MQVQMRLLSYNVCWNAMSAKGQYAQTCNVNGVMVCQNNVAALIDRNGPYDFVALQEASKSRDIQNKCVNTLVNMTLIHHKSGTEEMALFYDQNKYKLLKGQNQNDFIIKGEFSPGRPLMIAVFEIMKSGETVCVMNLHPGHGQEITRLENLISSGLGNPDVQSIRNTTHVIIMGDMNDPHKGNRFVGFG